MLNIWRQRNTNFIESVLSYKTSFKSIIEIKAITRWRAKDTDSKKYNSVDLIQVLFLFSKYFNKDWYTLTESYIVNCFISLSFNTLFVVLILKYLIQSFSAININQWLCKKKTKKKKTRLLLVFQIWFVTSVRFFKIKILNYLKPITCIKRKWNCI